MENIVNLLFNQYGLIVIFGIILGFFLIWLIAHFIAEENKEVSVLGIKYTKKINNNKFLMTSKNEKDFLKVTYKTVETHSEDKVYINDQIEKILGKTEGLTGAQRKTYLKENYCGKWMKIQGKVEDILDASNNYFLILGTTPTMIVFKFSISDHAKISHLSIGDNIIIEGQINEINSMQFTFIDSKILRTYE